MTEKKAFGKDKFDLDFSKIHQIIRPADVRQNDRLEARIRTRSTAEFSPVRVWKISPLGVEIVAPSAELMPSKGEPLDLELLVAGQRIQFDGLVVDIVKENNQIELLGVRFSKPESPNDRAEKRNSPRWLCSPDYYPTAICPTPGQINDNMHFKIRDISADGMLLTCSLRNKLPVPGLTLSLTANFGFDGTFNTPVQIKRVGFVSEGGKDRLGVGVVFKNLTPRMRSIMGQYLIQFSTASSLEELRGLGFSPITTSKAVNFGFLTTENEYKEVLRLRKYAHDNDYNLKEGVELADMGDIHDSMSRIIVGKHHGKIICTARIKFSSNDEPLEHESFVDWPDEFPNRREILEIGRLAVAPEYRHGDVLVGLFEYIAATCVHDRRYVVISCLKRMIPFFNKVGFSYTGLSYNNSGLFNQEGHVMIGDAVSTMLGRTISPIYWNLVWRRVSEYMIEAKTIDPAPLDKLRLTMYRGFNPIAKLFIALKKASTKLTIRNK